MPTIPTAGPFVPGQYVLVHDLRCSITASEDQAEVAPIPDGGHVANGGVVQSEWVHVTVEKKGPLPANNFKVNLTASEAFFKIGGQMVPAASYMLSLPGNSSVKLHSQVWTPYGGSHVVPVTVSVTVDTAQVIKETNEQNNTASIHYTVEHVT